MRTRRAGRCQHSMMVGRLVVATICSVVICWLNVTDVSAQRPFPGTSRPNSPPSPSASKHHVIGPQSRSSEPVQADATSDVAVTLGTKNASRLAQEAHRQAKKAQSLEELTNSLKVCREALDASPSQEVRTYVEKLAAWIYNKRGETLVELAGKTKERDQERAEQYDQAAVRDFDLAVQLDASAWKPRYNRAVSVAIAGNYEQALEDLDLVLRAEPGHVNARFNRAEILYQIGELPLAIEDYTSVLKTAPQDVDALTGRGLAQMDLGHYEEAMLDLNQAVKLDSENANAYVNRADLHATLGNWDRAASDYRIAIGLDQQNARAYRNVAWLMSTCPDAKYRNPTLAVRAAKKSMQLGGQDYRSLDTLAAALACAGSFKEAASTAQRALAVAPEDAQPMVQERTALYQAGQPYFEAEVPDRRIQLAAAEETAEEEIRVDSESLNHSNSTTQSRAKRQSQPESR